MRSPWGMCLEGGHCLRHVRNLLDFGITSRCREQATRGTKSPGTALSGPGVDAESYA